jgi:hypothetical protein
MLNAKIALVIFLGVFVGAWALAYSSNPFINSDYKHAKTNEETKHAGSSYTETAYYIIPVDSNVPTKKFQAHADADKKDDYNQAINERIMWATIAIAFFALVQSVIMGFQWWTVRIQTRTMEKTIKLTREEFIASHPYAFRRTH